MATSNQLFAPPLGGMMGSTGYASLSPNSQDLLLRGALSGSSLDLSQQIALQTQYSDLSNVPDVTLYQQPMGVHHPQQLVTTQPAPAPQPLHTRPRNGVPVNKLTVDLIRTYKQINQVRLINVILTLFLLLRYYAVFIFTFSFICQIWRLSFFVISAHIIPKYSSNYFLLFPPMVLLTRKLSIY